MPKEENPELKSRVCSTPRSDTRKHTKPRRQDLADYWRSRPWTNCDKSCRCDPKDKPTPKSVDAYRDAIEHLAAHKLGAAALTSECRELWRRGGSDRELAETVVRRWTA